MKRRSYRTQIRFQQTLYTLVLAFSLGLLLSIVTIVLDLLDERKAARENALDVIAAMKEQAAQAVFNIDPSLARLVVEGLSEYDLFVEVRIIDDLGGQMEEVVLAKREGILVTMAEVLLHSHDPITVALHHEGVKRSIGTIEVRLDSYMVAQQFFHRSLRTILGSLIRNVVLSLCLLSLFYYTLTRPILALKRQISMIDPHSPKPEITVSPLHKNTELGQISVYLNIVLENLKNVQLRREKVEQELIETKNHLEETVELRTKELVEANLRLEELARRDPLTGAYNRRAFGELALLEMANARRYQRPLALMLCDLDFFKRINDTHGHSFGDEVLKTFVDCVSATIREGDILARHGGEEFVILLNEIEPTHAENIGKRICEKFHAQHFKTDVPDCLKSTSQICFSVSIGLATVSQLEDYNLDPLLKKADKALYQAKQNGRNRLELAES